MRCTTTGSIGSKRMRMAHTDARARRCKAKRVIVGCTLSAGCEAVGVRVDVILVHEPSSKPVRVSASPVSNGCERIAGTYTRTIGVNKTISVTPPNLANRVLVISNAISCA